LSISVVAERDADASRMSAFFTPSDFFRSADDVCVVACGCSAADPLPWAELAVVLEEKEPSSTGKVDKAARAPGDGAMRMDRTRMSADRSFDHPSRFNSPTSSRNVAVV
jgi:hypothetical protein